MIHFFIAMTLIVFWCFISNLSCHSQPVILHIYCRQALMGIDGFLYAVEKLFMFNHYFKLRVIVLYLDATWVEQKAAYLRCLQKRFHFVQVCEKDKGSPLAHSFTATTEWIITINEDQTFYDAYRRIKDKINSEVLLRKNSIC